MKAEENPFPFITLEESGAPATPDAGNQALYIDVADHAYKTKNSSGSITTLAGGGGGSGQGLIDFGSALRTSGNVSCTANATWADVDTGMDITLSASTGDWIEVGMSGMCTGSEATQLLFDAVSIVSAAPVNSFGNGATPSDSNQGVSAWRIEASGPGKAGGSVLYQLAAGDISSSAVKIRLRYRTGNSTDRTLSASAASPLHFWAKNLGQSL